MPGPDTGEEFTDPVAHLVRTLPTVYRYGPAPADLAARVPSLVRLLGGVTPAPGGRPRTERQAFYERATSASTLLTTVVEAVGGVDGAALRIMTRTAEDPTRRRPRTLDQRHEAAGALRRVRGETFQRNYEPRLTLAFATALYAAAERRELTVPPRPGDLADLPPTPASAYAPRDGWTRPCCRRTRARTPPCRGSNPTAAGPRCHRRDRPPPHGRAAEDPAPCPPGRRARRRRRHRPGSAPRPGGTRRRYPASHRPRPCYRPAGVTPDSDLERKPRQTGFNAGETRADVVVSSPGTIPLAGGDPTRGADDGGPGGRRRPLSQPP